MPAARQNCASGRGEACGCWVREERAHGRGTQAGAAPQCHQPPWAAVRRAQRLRSTAVPHLRACKSEGRLLVPALAGPPVSAVAWATAGGPGGLHRRLDARRLTGAAGRRQRGRGDPARVGSSPYRVQSRPGARSRPQDISVRSLGQQPAPAAAFPDHPPARSAVGALRSKLWDRCAPAVTQALFEGQPAGAPQHRRRRRAGVAQSGTKATRLPGPLSP